MSAGTGDLKRYAAVAVLAMLLIVGGWILLRYGTRVLLPFSLLLQPIAEHLARRARIPFRVAAVAVLLLAIVSIVLLAVFAIGRAVREIGDLLRLLSENSEKIGDVIQRMVDYLSEIKEKLPIFGAVFENGALAGLQFDPAALLGELLLNLASSISAGIPGLAMRLVAGMPEVLLFLLVFLVSSFYFLLDGERIYAGIRRVMPRSVALRTVGLRGRVTAILYRYFRVYLVLFLITFLEILVGLLLLGRRYAFLLALLVAALDVLPVLGVGTVLLPWAAALFLLRDPRGAVGIIVLWGVVTVVRQVLEPRLFGESFGIHPLFALLALYAGLSLFGVVGIIVGPAVMVFLKLFYTEFLGKGTTPEKG